MCFNDRSKKQPFVNLLSFPSFYNFACVAGVAQWLERLTVDQEVTGSSPVPGTE